MPVQKNVWKLIEGITYLPCICSPNRYYYSGKNEPGVIAMNGYPIFPRSTEQMQFSVIPTTPLFGEGLTFLRCGGYSRRILDHIDRAPMRKKTNIDIDLNGVNNI